MRAAWTQLRGRSEAPLLEDLFLTHLAGVPDAWTQLRGRSEAENRFVTMFIHVRSAPPMWAYSPVVNTMNIKVLHLLGRDLEEGIDDLFRKRKPLGYASSLSKSSLRDIEAELARIELWAVSRKLDCSNLLEWRK